MERTGKVAASIGLVSTLLMGCYSPVLTEPTAAEKDNMYADHIEYVVTKDEKKYEFAEPPTIINDTIAGGRATFTWRRKVNEEVTSIPHSDVAWVQKTACWLGYKEHVVTKAGLKYRYEEQPTLLNGAYVGKGTFEGYVPLTVDRASIPLSDVAQTSVSRYNAVKTWIWVGAIGATIAVTAAILANNPIEFGPGTSGHW
jgi:hypothetical protein